MIKIAVVHYDNEAPVEAISAAFGQEGGTIGRSEENFLVLPDPKHYVSRSQASVWSNGSKHVMVNLSQANPILVNEQELEPDREYEIHDGDKIKIGLYLLTAYTSETEGEEPAVDQLAATGSAESVQADVAVEVVAEAAALADNHALLEAFLHGAGIPDGTISSDLTPELMETFGKMIAASIQGTLELIALRALVKREVKAETTVVMVRKNNSLKFFADSQTVLTQMLRKKMPGFMGPVESIEDAFEDLRAHQLGVVAGQRAAMMAMLRRLHPENFIKRQHAQTPTFLDKLIPARRKAVKWEMFLAEFRGISREAKDDFQNLFGKEFLSTYEKEIENFKKGLKND